MRPTRIIPAAMLSIAIVLAMAAPAFAWHPMVSGHDQCNEATGLYSLHWSVNNPNEDWNSNKFQMVVESDTRHAFAPGTSLAIGTTKEVVEENIPGTTSGTLTNTLTVYWTDGHEKRDRQTATATINLAGNCKVPTHVPAASATANSGCNTNVTLTTGDGNVDTQVDIVIPGSPAPIFSEKIGPNQTRQVAIPLEYGKSVDVQLVQDGELVKTIMVTRSSDETCNPTPTKVTGQVTSSACNTSSNVEAWTTRFEVTGKDGASVDVSYNWTAEGHTFDGQLGTFGVGEHFADINTPDWATPGMQLLLSVDYVVHGSSEFPQPILQQPITKGNCKATPANPQPQHPSTPTPMDTSLPVTGAGDLVLALIGAGAVIGGTVLVLKTRKRRGEELVTA